MVVATKNGGKCELIFEWIFYASPQAFWASQGGTPNTFHSDMASQNLFDGHENNSNQPVKYDTIEWIIYFIRSGYYNEKVSSNDHGPNLVLVT